MWLRFNLEILEIKQVEQLLFKKNKTKVEIVER